MSASPSHSRAFAAAIALAIVAATTLTSAADAFTVRGKVVNGTTGKSMDAKVYAVSPSSGMDEEQVVQSVNGQFEIKNLDNNVPLYLLRVDYADIPYNEPVQVDGEDKEVTVTVYETTSSWDGVRITMPHLAAVRDGDHLVVEQMYEINNVGEPARSIAGKEGFFRVFLPAEVDTITQSFVTSLNIPVDRDPEPTGNPNEYYLDYPIRPGITRIGLAYKVPYTGEFQLSQSVYYDIGHLSLFAVDPAMKITSSSHTLEAQEEVHGMASWSLHGLTKGSTLVLKFEGGHEHGPDVAGGGGGSGQVSVIPGQAESFSRYLMLTLALVLGTLAFVALRGASDPLTDAKVLRTHYDLLVTRLARLDDLNATGAISGDAHKAAREHLMSKLGVIAMQLRTHGGKAKDDSHKPEAAPHAVKRTQAS